MAISRRRFNAWLGFSPLWAWSVRPFSQPQMLQGGSAGSAAFARSAAGRTAHPVSSPWYHQLLSGVHLDYHFPEWDPYILSRANPRDDIKKMVDIGCEIVVVFAKDMLGNAYYNTQVGHKNKLIGERDFLREWSEEARKHKLTLLAYYVMNLDSYQAKHQPAWAMKRADGSNAGVMCYRSRGYRDFVKAQLREIMQYEIDGFHFDMLNFYKGLCYCPESCRPQFREKYGVEMPPEPTWDETWRKVLEFRYDSNAEFAEEMTALVRSVRPELSIMYNYHAQPPFSWDWGMKPVRHRKLNDYGTGEGYPPWFGHTYASLFSCFLSGVDPGGPWQGVSSRYTRSINDHTTRPTIDMEWEIFTFLAHGGMPLFVDTPDDDGTLDPLAYKRMGEVFTAVKKKQPFFGFEPVYDVGLYFSLKSRDWYGQGEPARYLRAYIGAHKALVESHLQVATIFDETVTLEQLQRFPVVYLANTAILDAKEAELLREYVRQGGNLLATFEASRFALDGKEKKDFDLADLFGVHYQAKTEFKGNYFALVAGPLSEGIDLVGNYFLPGPNNVVVPAGGTPHGELKLAFHDRGPETTIGHAPHNSAWQAVGPAVVVREVGKGKAVYVPFSPESAYLSDYPLPEHRLLIGNLLRYLRPQPAVRVEAPLNVEVVVRHDPPQRRYLVHLIPYLGVRDAIVTFGNRGIPVPAIEESFRYAAQVSLTTPVRAAFASSAGSRVKKLDRRVELETDEIHEVLVIGY